MRLSVKAGERDLASARELIGGLELPHGVFDFKIEPGRDEDGDPILWVLFKVGDHDRGDIAWVRDYTPFLKDVRRQLYGVLEEYRPVVGLT